MNFGGIFYLQNLGFFLVFQKKNFTLTKTLMDIWRLISFFQMESSIFRCGCRQSGICYYNIWPWPWLWGNLDDYVNDKFNFSKDFSLLIRHEQRMLSLNMLLIVILTVTLIGCLTFLSTLSFFMIDNWCLSLNIGDHQYPSVTMLHMRWQIIIIDDHRLPVITINY